MYNTKKNVFQKSLKYKMRGGIQRIFWFSFPINLLTTAIFKYKVKHMVKLGTSTLMVFRLIFLIIIKKIK